MKQILKGINAQYFFSIYCPDITNIYHKLRGLDGHNKEIDFSAEEKKKIRAGIIRMLSDIASTLKN